MLIYLVRHAWAGQYGDPQYADDTLRPLTEKGKTRFAHLAKKLAKRGVAPGAIATSSLVRARETAALLAAACPGPPPIHVLDDLAPGGSLGPLLEWSRQQALPSVAWVGHAPDIERAAAALLGAGHAEIQFGKGTVAAIEFGHSVTTGAGRLVWLATAELLRC